MKISDKKKDVPKLLSKINNNAAENKTGNETIPIIAVKKKVQTVNGSLLLQHNLMTPSKKKQ